MEMRIIGYDDYVKEFEEHVINREDNSPVSEDEIRDRMKEALANSGCAEETWIELYVDDAEGKDTMVFIFDCLDYGEGDIIIRYAGLQ